MSKESKRFAESGFPKVFLHEQKRLFFAVNLPDDVKKEISENVLPKIPKDGWNRVSKENLHVTMHF